MTKKERLEAIIAHYSDGKKGSFAAYIGVAPSTISSWLDRDTYDHELLYAKCEGISASWLLTGEGEMLSKCEPQQSSCENKKNRKIIIELEICDDEVIKMKLQDGALRLAN